MELIIYKDNKLKANTYKIKTQGIIEKSLVLILPESYDFVLNSEVIDELLSHDYKIKKVHINFENHLHDRFTRHVIILISFLKPQGKVKKNVDGDITKIIHDCYLNFNRSTPELKTLKPDEQEKIKAIINKKYLDIVVQNNYIIPSKKNPQKEVKSRFDNIGLVDDIMLSSHGGHGRHWIM